MSPQSWSVLLVAAAFLLLGIAGSPLAWLALGRRRSLAEHDSDRRFHELTTQLRALQARVERAESSEQTQTEDRVADAEAARTRGLERCRPAGPLHPLHGEPAPARTSPEPPMIAVPNLAATNEQREAAVSGLAQRYSAIWTLADTGASPEVIARATGQPIGLIELILGLRRQIDGNRTTIPHAPHV
jgi:hypothetical protein